MSLVESLLTGEDVRAISIQGKSLVTGINVVTGLRVREQGVGAGELDPTVLRLRCKSNGRLLLKCFLTRWVERYPSVHVFLYDMEGPRWTSGLAQNITEKFVLHCGYSEHWCGEKGSNLLKDFSAQKCVDAVGNAPLQEVAVIIDSVSTLLLHHTLSHVVRSLKLLGSKVAALLYIVHSGLHDSHVMSELNHVTFTCILLKSQEPTDNRTGQKGSCSIVHCKKSGRVIKKDEVYEVTEGYQLSGHEVDATPIVATHSQDPAANLTFSISLSSKEKSDRAKTVLPYIKQSGQIHYQPDQSDDIDHSDPDDDLDI
ncbi:hypothetical protein EMCRGX_G023685 [Ephydatia muelleri]